MENDRSWSAEFAKYVEEIAASPAYRGLYIERNRDGVLNWVVTGKSEKGQERLHWWQAQCRKLRIPIKSGCYAIAARAIHPTKRHVCQCCGKALSIDYVYPNKTLLSAINERFGCDLSQTEKDIFAIIKTFCRSQEDIQFFVKKFKLEGITSKNALAEAVKRISSECRAPLSPGVMSNCPDRFDGFHSDGLCCRSNTDKGRHADNLKTYTQDRRAYEEWADGNYNLANRLMGEYRKLPPMRCPECGKTKKLTADHVGPISLGFCHDLHFAPMCRQCNSAKNNRLSLSDVRKLIALEEQGSEVISWHSKHLWDVLKPRITDDESAKKASAVLAAAHQNVLKLFSLIYKETGQEYLLRFLHREYSLVDYRFEDFDPYHPENVRVIKKECESKNKQKNQERYVRAAFEHLKDFDRKDNRKNRFVLDQMGRGIEALIQAIREGRTKAATRMLNQAIASIGEKVLEQEWPD